MKPRDVEKYLASGGLLSKTLPDYRPREGQIEFSKEVADAIENRSVLLCEAGTGVGKSFAYLVPALLKAEEGGKVVISTATKTLQDQLFNKDLPFLLKAMGKTNLKVALLVGRGNYICKRRFYSNSQFANKLNLDEESRNVRKIIEYVENSAGLIGDIPAPLPQSVALEDILSDGELCMRNRCPYYPNRCHYYKAKESAQKADILVINHYLLFCDVNLSEDLSDSAVLTDFPSLIIDEAHSMDKIATKVFSAEFKRSEFVRNYSRLSKNTKTQEGESLISLIARLSKKEADGALFLKHLESIMKQVDTLFFAAQELKRDYYKTTQSPLLDHSPRQDNIYDSIAQLAQALSNFCLEAETLALGIPEKLSEAEEYQLKLFKRALKFFNLASATLYNIVSFENDSLYAKYFECDEKDMTLYVAAIDVSPELHEKIFEHFDSVVCCSATLMTRGNFKYFKTISGAYGDSVFECNYTSPFDKRHRQIVCEVAGPTYDIGREAEYEKEIISRITLALEASKGGALVLFTSYKMMKNVYAQVGQLTDLTIYCQGRENSRDLLRKFKEESNSVLFATNTFWEGIDVPGESLRLVIIAKLPFKNTQDPIGIKRKEYCLNNGVDYFQEYALPEMEMSLKQGIGRLIRNESDKGIVYILDSKKRFLSHTVTSWMKKDEIPNFIFNFFRQ